MARIPTRPVLCQHCKEKAKFNEEEWTVYIHKTETKEYRKYLHKKCYDEFVGAVNFKENESSELDELVKTVGSIHNAPKNQEGSYILPRWFYHEIQDMRNGTHRYTRKFKKRYKQGIPYSVLTQAYKLSKDGIEWSKMTKQFRDVGEEIRYGLAIMKNKLPDAMKREESKRHQEKVNEALEQDKIRQFVEDEQREVKYRKKKSKIDISEFLD